MVEMTCEICGSTEQISKDHCHTTGKDRGLLCKGHNLGLGYFGNDPDLLRNGAAYLDRYPIGVDRWHTKYSSLLKMHSEGLSHRAIARRTGYGKSSIYRYLKLARAIELFPDLIHESTDYDAWKMYERMENSLPQIWAQNYHP